MRISAEVITYFRFFKEKKPPCASSNTKLENVNGSMDFAFCLMLTIRSILRPLLSTNQVVIPVAMIWEEKKLIIRTEFPILILHEET